MGWFLTARRPGTPFTLWAPLFPVLAAIPGLLGLDAPAAAGLLNAAALGGLVFAVGWRLRRSFGSPPLALWGALAVMLSIPLTYASSRALSEPIFLLLTALALLRVEQFLDDGKRSALVGAAIFTALACLTRYSGVAIVIAVAPLLLCRGAALPARVRDAALYCVIALLPVGIWTARNYLLGGARAPSETTVAEYLTALLRTVASWAFPIDVGSTGDALPGALLGLLALSPLAMAGILAARRWRQAGRVSGTLLVPVVFSLSYLAFLLTASAFTGLEIPGDRYVSPVYVPLVLAAAAVAAWWQRRNCALSAQQAPTPGRPSGGRRRWRRRLQSALRVAPLLGLFLGLAYPLTANVADIRRGISEGIGGYSNARWADSALVPQIRRHWAGIEYQRLYANDPSIPYVHAGITALPLPHTEKELRSIHQNPAAADGIYVLWLERQPVPPREYGRRELERLLPNPQTLIEDQDGALFYVSAASIAASIEASKRAAAAAVYAEAQAMGAPAIASVYEVYIDDDRLIYLKEPCAVADTVESFYLHLYPTPSDRLESDEEILEYGYHIRDFDFDRYGRRIGEYCVASVPHPGYEIAGIRTGQYTEAGRIWESGVDIRRSVLRQMQLDGLTARQPVVSDEFAVYWGDGELAYLKEPCAAGDTAAAFYLHIVPANSGDLPAEQREYGFDNRDFAFDAVGWSLEGICLATVALPEYDIALIRTGQYTEEGRIWESEFAAGAGAQ